jgi:hypothetical protein
MAIAPLTLRAQFGHDCSICTLPMLAAFAAKPMHSIASGINILPLQCKLQKMTIAMRFPALFHCDASQAL